MSCNKFLDFKIHSLNTNENNSYYFAKKSLFMNRLKFITKLFKNIGFATRIKILGREQA